MSHKAKMYPKIAAKIPIFSRFNLFALLVILLIGSASLCIKYEEYLEFIYSNELQLKVQKSYPKNNAQIIVLSFSHANIYTRAKKGEFADEKELRARFFNANKLSFFEFLGGNFFLASHLESTAKSQEKNDLFSLIKTRAKNYIFSQHKSEKMREFYGALFLAKPISSELRNDVNFNGVAHLLAISGYHLGLIYATCFFLLNLALKGILRRYFAWMHRAYFFGLCCIALLAFYFTILGLVPSYFRSFTMLLAGFLALIFGVRLISFNNFFLCVLACVAISPNMLFSVGFFFSALGVFYILLFVHHFQDKFVALRAKKAAQTPATAAAKRAKNRRDFGVDSTASLKIKARGFAVVHLSKVRDFGVDFLARKNWLKNLGFLMFFEAFIFFAMVIPVLCFFPLLSLQQLFALVLTPLFVVFYPIAALLHIFNLGDLMDSALLFALDFKMPFIYVKISKIFLIFYLFTSLLAIRFRWLIWLIFALNLGVYAINILVLI